MADQEVKAIFSADTSGITSGASTAAAAVSGYQKSASSAMNAVGKGMVVAGAAITAVGVTSLKSFGDFQSSLNQAAVIAGGTSKDINGLADVANKMGADLPISAGAAARAMVAMARDGATIKTIKAEFPAIAQAATAAGADLERTASVVQQSMNIWGDSIQSPQRAAAVLTQTANLSNASIEDMQQALASIGGTAHNAGIDMQTTSTAIGLLTNRGFSAAQASQDLNHALLLMQAPSKKGREMMSSLGLSMTDLNGNMKPLPQILNEIGDATEGMTSSDKAAALKTMFGSAGMAAILPLMDSVKDKTGNATTSWSAFTKEMDKASGSTQTATKFLKQQADEMQKNLGSKIEQVGGNWEALSNKAMAGSAGVTGSFLDMTNSALSWAGSSNSSMAQFARQMIGLAPAIGPGVVAVGTFLTNFGRIGKVVMSAGSIITGTGVMAFKLIIGTIKTFQTVVTVARTAMLALNAAFLANPIAIIVVAIVAVTAALVYFFTQTETGRAIWSSFVQFMSGVWNSITSGVQSAGQFIVSIWTNTVATVQSVWNGITTFFSNLWTTIITGITTAWSGVVTFFTTIWNTIIATLQPLFTAFTTGWNNLVTTLTGIWNGIVSVATGIWNLLYSAIMGVVLLILDFVTGNFTQLGADAQMIWNSIVSAITGIWNGIVQIATSIFTGLMNFINQTWNNIANFASSVWNGIVSTVTGIWNGFVSSVTSLATSLFNGIKGVWDAIPGWASGLWNGVKSTVSNVWNGIVSTVTNLANSAINGLKGAWNGITGWVSDLWNGVKSTVQGALNFDLGAAGKAIMDSFLGGLKKAWEGVKNFVGGIADWVRDHKGPISYDKRLLIPAGKAIMGGFNSSLQSSFEDVKKTVNGVAPYIASAISGQGDYMINTRLSDNMQLDNGSLSVDMNNNAQPANIKLVMGGSDWTAHVNDISNTQGNSARLSRNNSVYL